MQKAITLFLTSVLFFFGNLFGINRNDTAEAYIARVESVPVFRNTMETAVPQTEMYTLISEHFQAPLPEGKTEKKVIVLGYDGCRADNFTLIRDAGSSAIQTLLDNGGQAVISYCGGVNYPAVNTQATSTAPGWCSMLTGQWANVHHVSGNFIPKTNRHLTLLTTLVQNGTIDSSAFYVSWFGHFNNPFCTYYPEKKYVEKNNIAANFVCAEDDKGTEENILADLRQADCSDFIFSILEYCDHTGHDSGFGLNNSAYAQAFADAEQTAGTILAAIQARPTFDTEDWLILITSDHGGFNKNHGRVTLQERMTFIVSNKALRKH